MLFDTGRSVPLYAVGDCELVPTRNVQGGQYTRDGPAVTDARTVTCGDAPAPVTEPVS